jgi:hypothetical protein
MRHAALGLAVLIAASMAAVAAQASDFVVVSSTDPAIPRGQSVAAGATLPLGVGKTLVLIDTSGQITRVTGAVGGAMAPRRQMVAANSDRVAVLKMLVAPPRLKRSGPGGKVCPEADLTAFDGIVATAQVDGCLSRAREAFEIYVARATVP